jgi:hypothetical protein
MADIVPDPARLQIRLASTDSEIDACEEVMRLGFGRVMRLGVEPESDERRSLKTFYCFDSSANRIVATSRLVTLDYIGRSDALVREYRIATVPDDLRRRGLLSFQSAALPDQRGTEVMSRLFKGVWEYGLEGGFLLTVSACKPFLFPYFMSMGFRPYERAYISTDGGYRIPIVLIHHDQDYLRACRSPFASELASAPEVPGAAAALQWFNACRPSQKDMNVRIISRPEHIDFDLHFFQGLSEATIHAIFRFAVEITCEKGDQLVKEKAADQVIGFVLEGTVDVLKGDRKVATLKAGEVFGEVAFLLKGPRTASLVASAERTRIAFISVHSLDAIKDPVEAGTFWRNLCGHLAARLQQSTEQL